MRLRAWSKMLRLSRNVWLLARRIELHVTQQDRVGVGVPNEGCSPARLPCAAGFLALLAKVFARVHAAFAAIERRPP